MNKKLLIIIVIVVLILLFGGFGAVLNFLKDSANKAVDVATTGVEEVVEVTEDVFDTDEDEEEVQVLEEFPESGGLL